MSDDLLAAAARAAAAATPEERRALADRVSAVLLVGAAESSVRAAAPAPGREPTWLGNDVPDPLPTAGDDMPTLTNVSALPEPAPHPSAAPATPPAARYRDMEPIGAGGMGQVFRVWDTALHRWVALKAIQPRHRARADLVGQFREEARVAALLDHPGVIQVYDVGFMDDGRPYYTMREVRGRTLSDVIDEVHRASRTNWERSGGGWSLRRMIESLRRVCEAVAFSHDRGVLHLDLKPSNIMLGAYGEVTVVDWGLARRIDGEGPTIGFVGTPAYMAPELGTDGHATPAADVYALGATLHHILTGRPPPPEGSERSFLGSSTVSGTPTARDRDAKPPTTPSPPSELLLLCRRAMSPDPASRPSAIRVAEELGTWLDGVRKRARALELVEAARALQPRARELRQASDALADAAARRLADLPPSAPIDVKRAAWTEADRAATLAVEAEVTEVELAQRCWAALTHAPDLAEAHATLADHYQEQHARAESRRDDAAAARYAALLRHHDAGQHAAWLRGDGYLTLHTSPPASVRLLRVARRDRRLVPQPSGTLGGAPLEGIALARGSWLLELRAPERMTVRYPVRVGRLDHWDGSAPDHLSPGPIRLPRAGALGPDDVLVARGPYLSGGLEDEPLTTRWLEGFVMRRFPVTNAEFIAFLDDLVAMGNEEEALRHAPRERAPDAEGLGPSIFSFDGARFGLQVDADGHAWQPDVPVVMIDWFAASAFAAWYANKTGLPWRLPTADEREKAGRGVDGRSLPWGDHIEPNWCCIRDSHHGEPTPQPVTAFPEDESIYGVRGLAGNVRDWCADVVDSRGRADAEGGYRLRMGAFWNATPEHIHLARRVAMPPRGRGYSLGFRLVRGLVEDDFS